MVSAPPAGTVVARLLTAPHLFHPGWLLGDHQEHAGPAERPGRPDVPRAGADQEPGTAGAEGRQNAKAAGSREPGAAMDAVPFAAATPIAPAVAGRLAAAVRAAGEHLVFACPVATGRSAELAAAIQADGAQIHAALQALGTPDALAVLPDLSAALLTTAAGFAVAAGPRRFAEAVAGAEVRRARAGFAEFALASARSSVQPLHAARYYGCALSGRPWRPFWRAWARAADVPYGTGIGVQLSAMRDFVDGRLNAADFGRMFRAARQQEMRAGERAAALLAAALDATYWALDAYVPPEEGYPRTPGHLDLDGLREAVSVALRDV